MKPTLLAQTTTAETVLLDGNVLISSALMPAFNLNNTFASFAPDVSYTTGDFPFSVNSLDANADGKIDLAVANLLSNTVSVFLGKGDGTFTAKVDYTTGSRPSSVTSLDANGDGRMDLVVSNSASNTVSVMLGKGDGTFAAKVDYATGSSPYSAISADVNADGKMDLIVANSGAGTVSVLLGRGDGSFAAKVDYKTLSSPYSVTSLDANGDGKTDLAVTSEGSYGVSVLLNNGNGTFASKVDYATSSYSRSVTSFDANSDGKMDLAVANRNSNNISVLQGNGDGTFSTKVDYAVGENPYSVTSLDANGDGKMDLVVANRDSNNISVLQGNGDGTFAAKFDYATGIDPWSVTSFDANGDGKMDLAVANVSSDTVSVLLNMTSPTAPTVFLPSPTVSILEGNSASQLLTFTVNLSAAASSSLTVNYATANGTATAGSDYIATSGILTFAAGEISKTVAVSVLGDTVNESNETFTLSLSSPNGATLGAITSTTATIINDDTVTINPDPGNPTLTPNTNIINDFVVLQASTKAVAGAGEGNDTYLLSGSMIPAGQAITISDSLGANSIQLANGLHIASAKVTAKALKLTLDNGASITVLGADKFTFEAGGNTTAGINNPDISYSQFVQSVLGVAIPATGITTSGPVIIGGGSISVSGNQVVNATAAAEVFVFDAVSAIADVAGTDTNAFIHGFSVATDRLMIDLASANSSLTSLDQLDGIQGISVEVDPFAKTTLINFGSDDNGGEPVGLTLVGITDTAMVQIQVV